MRPTPFLVTVVMIVATGTVWLLINPSAQRAEALAARVQSLRKEVADLAKEKQRLTARRDLLENDPLTVEREVRRQFRMVRPGEVAGIAAPRRAPEVRAETSGPKDLRWTRAAIYAVLGLLAITLPALIITARERD